MFMVYQYFQHMYVVQFLFTFAERQFQTIMDKSVDKTNAFYWHWKLEIEKLAFNKTGIFREVSALLLSMIVVKDAKSVAGFSPSHQFQVVQNDIT